MPRYDERNPRYADLEVFERTPDGARQLYSVRWVDTDAGLIGEYVDEWKTPGGHWGIRKADANGEPMIRERKGAFFVRDGEEINPPVPVARHACPDCTRDGKGVDTCNVLRAQEFCHGIIDAPCVIGDLAAAFDAVENEAIKRTREIERKRYDEWLKEHKQCYCAACRNKAKLVDVEKRAAEMALEDRVQSIKTDPFQPLGGTDCERCAAVQCKSPGAKEYTLATSSEWLCDAHARELGWLR